MMIKKEKIKSRIRDKVQQNKGDGQGNDPNRNQNNEGKIPKGLENQILNKVSEKEKETARRILNKNSYSMPESNEKDW